MVKIKFIGPKPIVSDKGVRFDPSQPDKYTYLGAALELAEAFDIEGEAHDIVYRAKTSQLSETVINEMLAKYCPDLDTFVKEREEKAKAMVEDLKRRVEEHRNISEEGRQAWLKNIEAMYDYYLQYITNEAAYDCVVQRIAEEVEKARIKEIRVPLLNHFGMVLHDLSEVLEQRRPPIDSDYHVEQTPQGIVAVMKLRHV